MTFPTRVVHFAFSLKRCCPFVARQHYVWLLLYVFVVRILGIVFHRYSSLYYIQAQKKMHPNVMFRCIFIFLLSFVLPKDEQTGDVLVELSELAVRTKHVYDLVLVHLLHEVASGTAVLAGVELSGLLGEHLAYSSGEGQT